MNQQSEQISGAGRSFRSLPIAHTLRKYDESKWISFGSLTYAQPASQRTAVEDFKKLMGLIGWENLCFEQRLHWFLRLEGCNGGKNLHLHFLLGDHKITNGYHRPLTPESACKFLKDHWTHGIADVRPYEAGRGGVGYVTKVTRYSDLDDHYELSRSLHRALIPKEITA